MPQQQRRKYWVNPRIQGRLIGRVGFYWLVYHLVLWHAMFLVRYLGYRAALITGESQYVSFQELYRAFATDYTTLAVCAVVLAPLFLYDMLQQSHRLAGPLLRCENTLRRLMAGEQVAPIKFRDNDLPVDFGETFNTFLEFYSARQNQSPVQPVMTPQQAALLESLIQERANQPHRPRPLRLPSEDNEAPEIKEDSGSTRSLLTACRSRPCGRQFAGTTPAHVANLRRTHPSELLVQQSAGLVFGLPGSGNRAGHKPGRPDPQSRSVAEGRRRHCLARSSRSAAVPRHPRDARPGVRDSAGRSYRQLESRQQRIILYGSGERWLEATLPADESSNTEADPKPRARRTKRNAEGPAAQIFRFQYKGLYPAIEEASRVSFEYRQALADLVGETTCSACQGTRIREDAAAVRLRGKSLPQICQLPLREALGYLESLALNPDEGKIAGDLLNEVIHRLRFLVEVGLEYLTLDRPMPTLSGGESQRIRLAGQIGRALTGVLYVLDEPTIGLHPRDNHRLISALERLRDLGNTVVLVEHDREVIDAADRLYDFGPGSGRHGGQIVAEGRPAEFETGKLEGSLTADYLSGRKSIAIPKTRRMVRKSEAAAAPAAKSTPARKPRKKNDRDRS